MLEVPLELLDHLCAVERVNVSHFCQLPGLLGKHRVQSQLLILGVDLNIKLPLLMVSLFIQSEFLFGERGLGIDELILHFLEVFEVLDHVKHIKAFILEH